MENRDRTDQDEVEEVVDVEAVEVEDVGPADAQAVEEGRVSLEDAEIPPFLERDVKPSQGAEDTDAAELQADEVETDAGTRAAQADEGYLSLFEDGAESEYRKHWMDIQARFVDDPQASVREADELVDQVVRHISDTFARQRSDLESGWTTEGDSESSTEDLRLAVKRYHTFFDQLLNLKP